MADKELEEDLPKHNYYCEQYFVNYKDFSNSIGSPLASFTNPVNRTFFFSPERSHCLCLGLLQCQYSSHVSTMINTVISYSTQAKAV